MARICAGLSIGITIGCNEAVGPVSKPEVPDTKNVVSNGEQVTYNGTEEVVTA